MAKIMNTELNVQSLNWIKMLGQPTERSSWPSMTVDSDSISTFHFLTA
jgi:hypothetical protein